MAKLTPELKSEIDGMGVEQLLRKQRQDPLGDPFWSDESGLYAGNRLKRLRVKDPNAYIQASKTIGWNVR